MRRRFPIGVAVGLAVWGAYDDGVALIDGVLGRTPLVVTPRGIGILVVSLAVLILLHRRASIVGIAIGLLIPLAVMAVLIAALALACAHTQCFAF